MLARVDPRLFKASVDRDTATLSTREADLERIEAQLQQSLNNYLRGKRLRDKNEDFLSDREMDALVFEVKSLQAQRKLAKASILQARASLETSQANLKYCEVTSPVDGVVINRLINPGQIFRLSFKHRIVCGGAICDRRFMYLHPSMRRTSDTFRLRKMLESRWTLRLMLTLMKSLRAKSSRFASAVWRHRTW